MLVALMCVIISGCRRPAMVLPDDPAAQDADAGLQFTVYYVNEDGSGLTGKKFTPEQETFEGLLNELMEHFMTPPDNSVRSALPEGVEILGHSMGVDNLIMDFGGSYLGLDNVQEVLLRAAMVRTLIQLPGIVTISFTVDGQNLMEDGSAPVGPMNEETFIDTAGKGINSYHTVSLQLYFPDATGNHLGVEHRNVSYSSNLILERVIADEIIRGPSKEGLQKVMDPDTLIRKIYIDNDVCYIDLSEDANRAPGDGVDAETALYAFVDSICSIRSLRGVQFMIGGSWDLLFWDKVALDQVFEWNEDQLSGPLPAGTDGSREPGETEGSATVRMPEPSTDSRRMTEMEVEK